MEKLKWINLVLRGMMEIGIILGLGYWGYQLGRNTLLSIILCIAIPLIGFGFWGLVDFHNFGRIAEYLRLTQEMLISGVVAVLLYSAGVHLLGWALGAISIVHHVLIYVVGDTLQKHHSSE